MSTTNTNTNFGSGQILAAQGGAYSTPNVSGDAVNQSSSQIEQYQDVVQQFARALSEAGDDLDTNTRATARYALRQADESRGESDPDVMARSAHMMRDIAVSAGGSGAWAGVVAAVDHLMRLFGAA